MTQINYTVTIDGQDIEVTFYGEPNSCDDGIGSYEYQGYKGHDSRPYVSCEDSIEIDKVGLTVIQLLLVDKWLENKTNYAKIDKLLCEENEKNSI